MVSALETSGRLRFLVTFVRILHSNQIKGSAKVEELVFSAAAFLQDL